MKEFNSYWFFYFSIFHKQVGESGRVVGIDHIPDLVDMSVENVRKEHAQLMDSGRLKLIGKKTESVMAM